MLNLSELPNVRGVYKFSEPLKKYTWLNVGGPADVMFFPQDITDLQYFLQNKNTGIPIFVLGGGSNLLVRDGGIDGVVIKLSHKNFTRHYIKDNILYCGAGTLNSSLKNVIVNEQLGGLEFLCSIPGTIGGTLRSNAGCFGSDISAILHSATVMDSHGNIFVASPEDFNFSYRHSEFPADWIVLEVGLEFVSKNKEDIAVEISKNSEYRKMHQPQGIRTAGSTFKNPDGYAAWKLIKESEAANFAVGKVKMSPLHCNFLQNEGSSAADIETLCDKIIQSVLNKTGVKLEMEVQKVGKN